MSAFRNMLAPSYAGFAHVPSGLPYPAAGAERPVGDGAPRFASQIDAAIALRYRLNRDRVSLHAVNDTPERGTK